jgi:hypothetical protein
LLFTIFGGDGADYLPCFATDHNGIPPGAQFAMDSKLEGFFGSLPGLQLHPDMPAPAQDQEPVGIAGEVNLDGLHLWVMQG